MVKRQLLVFTILFLALEGSAFAKTPDRGALLLSVGVGRYQDDNVLQLTSHNLDRFAANPAPPRFLIESPQGTVNRVDASIRWIGRPISRLETKIGAELDVRDDEVNDVMDWRKSELTLTQGVMRSRGFLLSLSGWWSRIPHYYLGQVTDEDASFAAGTRIRSSLAYSQSTLGARQETRWLRGKVRLSAGFERVRRDYGAEFAERDNHNDQWRLDAGVRPFRHSGLVARVIYETGSLSARGDLASSPIRDADLSYDHHGLGGAVTFPWGSDAMRGRLEAEVMPQVREYTTPDQFDITRYGKVARRLQASVRVVQRLWGPLEGVAEWERLTSDADFTKGIEIPSDRTDFNQTRYGLMLRGRWQAKL